MEVEDTDTGPGVPADAGESGTSSASPGSTDSDAAVSSDASPGSNASTGAPDSTDADESPEAGEVPTRQVVEFRLGEDRCAVDIDEVDGIVETKKVTRIPRTPDAVDGVMDLRGETTAIIDPRSFLGVEGDPPDRDDQNVLVLDRPDDKQKLGVRVDEVLAVSTYPEDRIDAGDDLADLDTRGVGQQVSRGLIRRRDGDDIDLVIWIDVDAVVDQLR